MWLDVRLALGLVRLNGSLLLGFVSWDVWLVARLDVWFVLGLCEVGRLDGGLWRDEVGGTRGVGCGCRPE